MSIIDSFLGKFNFLSNFYYQDIIYEGIKYPTVEHAYQAAKTLNQKEKIKISKLQTPGNAKRFGQTVNLRCDWETVKIDIMFNCLKLKFKNEILKKLLIATNDCELIEGNYWFDYYWGVCNGHGENNLGKLLMKIRTHLLQE